ncbi:MAG: hypothetical protein ABEK59_08760 [Halobacteria archaeon]
MDLSSFSWLPGALKREVSSRVVRPFVKRDYEETVHSERDWDNLIILDACRYDAFQELNPFDVEPEIINSCASHTKEFLKKNFSGEHHDTVYVTASPWVREYAENFAEVRNVWKDGWSDEDRTVLPETLTSYAKEANREYPNKKLVVHYMQPHYPFVGGGPDLGEQAGFRKWWGRDAASVWERLSRGELEEGVVREAYRKNLEGALPHLEDLVEELRGKTVVSSDHGNLYGKRVCWIPIGVYGHPPGIHDQELTAVPWLELPFEERKEIKDAGSGGDVDADIEESEVQDRLEDLGYT